MIVSNQTFSSKKLMEGYRYLYLIFNRGFV